MFVWTDRLLMIGPSQWFSIGIIDDLIVKAKVFGTPVGQILLSFLKISASLHAL